MLLTTVVTAALAKECYTPFALDKTRSWPRILVMFTFSGENIPDIILELPHKIARNCNQYTIMNGDITVGKVYGGRKFTFIKYADRFFRIDRHQGFFESSTYQLVEHGTEVCIGYLAFTDSWLECTLSLIEGATFYFHKESFASSFFKPSTWSKFRNEMTSSTDKIIYTGKYRGSSLEGIIETTNDNLLLPMMAGIYILEERIRIGRDNAG